MEPLVSTAIEAPAGAPVTPRPERAEATAQVHARELPGHDRPGRSSADHVARALDEAPLSRFHRKAVVVSGMGFFTDAYDLFVISTVAALVSSEWHLSTAETSWVSGAAVLGAFIGAIVFGRLADIGGRKKVYALVAAVMVVGAISSALAPDLLALILSRFLLGLGIGGDYPVSAVLMSEYSNRRDRGRLVGMVFSMQALGLMVGPLVALGLLESHVGHDLTWRLLLGLGAAPALGVLYLRARMPESPRFHAEVRGRGAQAAHELATFSQGALPELAPSVTADNVVVGDGRDRVRLADARMLKLIVGTAGAWFVFDYAYYGNTLSLPVILKGVEPGASVTAKLMWSLAMFVAFAVPGYLAAISWMDRIGHRRLQSLGFGTLVVAFFALAAIPALTASVGAFIAVFGVSYFFVEFGPNTTTFVLPSEVFPVYWRTTGHGIAAGLGKLGAFAGVFLVPALETSLGLRPMLAIAAGAAALGVALTRLLPEPARKPLGHVSPSAPQPGRLAAAVVAVEDAATKTERVA
jgi:PHS family inorganic phosphate transporter-like MFS transporter